MTRNELIASLVPSVAAGLLASAHRDGSVDYIVSKAEALADEMIKRGIVNVSAETKEPA